MGALFGLLTIVIVLIIGVRIGSIALELTGLSHDIASFQAQSAFSGVGFTTSESESVMSHPVRRGIIRSLFLLGSAGITSLIATFVLTFVGQTGENIAFRIQVLFIGLIIILLFSRSKVIYGIMRKIITMALRKWTKLRIYDYEQLLGLSKGYHISRITVKKNSWLADKKVEELRLNLEGILILSLYRNIETEEKFIGVPESNTVIEKGDILICYTREDAGKSLAQRPKGEKGDEQHQAGITKEKDLAKVRKITGGYDS